MRHDPAPMLRTTFSTASRARPPGAPGRPARNWC